MTTDRRGLEAGDRRFAALLHASGDVYLETDSHGRMTFLAGSVEEHFGAPREDLQGTSVFDMLRAADGDRARALWAELGSATSTPPPTSGSSVPRAPGDA